MILNNYLQEAHGTTAVYDDSWRGPQDAAIWTSVVSFNGIEYGRGSARSKNASREEAATRAVRALNIDRIRYSTSCRVGYS